MNLVAKSFTLVATRRGALVAVAACDSMAEAEVRFDVFAARGLVDRGEIFAADRSERPVRVLQVR